MKWNARSSTVAVVVFLSVAAYGADSPRFRGPEGDGVFPETGLPKQWPQGGPKLAWSVQGLGKGFSSPVVVKDAVYVTGMDGQGQGCLFAFGSDGSQKWKTAYGPEFAQGGPAKPGTRGTPTVDGDQVFVMTSFGKLLVFDAAKGQAVKTIDVLDRFGAAQAKFGFAECVLVDGQKVVCTPGSPGAALAALDRKTGETIWQTQGFGQPSAYCSARLIRHGQKPMIVTMMEKAVIAVDPDTGKVLWQYDYPQRFGVQPNPPLYRDGMLYICSGAGAGGAMLALADDGQSVTLVWMDKTLDCQMHGVVALDGCIYGTAQSGNKGLVCLDWKTGKAMWNAADIKAGVVISADGMLYVYADSGTMYLVKPSPESFQPAGQFAVTQGTEEHWTHPTIANGRLYIRHGDVLMAYDIKAGS
jgi:outer membrane protein assembly factor BamB